MMEIVGLTKVNGSGGPRTTEGKAAVAKNALKHGGYSQAIVVLGEDPDAYEALHDGMVSSLRPDGPLEEELVDHLTRLWWRLQRVGRAEREGLKCALERELRRHQLQQVANPVQLAFSLSMGAGDGHYPERLQRHEAQLERSFLRLLHELERVQGKRKGEEVLPPVVVEMNVSAD